MTDWQNSLTHNPALAINEHRLAGGFVYAQPFGLQGLTCARAAVNYRLKMLHITSGLQVLGLKNEREFDLGTVLGTRLLTGLTVGIGIHGLVRDQKGYGGDFASALDFGILWLAGRLRLGIAGQRLNSPRFRAGDELNSVIRAGLSWEPVSALHLAIDAEKDSNIERLLGGAELRLFPELCLRCGVETFPFSLRAGMSVRVDWLSLDYGYHYHPQLGDTHILGINLIWN
ncbi:MAG: hypothetical protein ACUVUR_01770 [bacterium]